MNNSTTLTSGGGGVVGEVVANLTSFESVYQWPLAVWERRDIVWLQTRIIGTALACIYLGSNAALRRPPSASPARKKRRHRGAKQEYENELDGHVQGLLLSDAVMFPVLAGIVLVSLYYLIRYLEDPAILNKILQAYFSIMSLASMGKFFADVLDLVAGLVFPDAWTAPDGALFHFDAFHQAHYRLSDSGQQALDPARNTPFPGARWSRLRLSDRTRQTLWQIRHLVREPWSIKVTVHGLINETVPVRLNQVAGVLLALAANIVYYRTRFNFLSNVMGCAFSYTTLIMMTPTTFTTGNAVLFGLFFYDIYMVFYTPYMVTVATKLDVPIKLIFKTGKSRSSMLGLGDIVIPGMFVGLCLRFDHFMHYYRQRKLVTVELESKDASSGQPLKTHECRRVVVKPEYINPQGQWGNWLWSTPARKLLAPDATPALRASAFPKPYFLAAMVGYFAAMLVTVAVLLIYQHAQPALLYLVPGVVSAVWLTGAVRGELHEMWIYTEDGSLDKKDVIVEVDGDGNVVKELDKDEKDVEGKDEEDVHGTDVKEVEQAGKGEARDETTASPKGKGKGATIAPRVMFTFSILLPSPAVEVVDP